MKNFISIKSKYSRKAPKKLFLSVIFIRNMYLRNYSASIKTVIRLGMLSLWLHYMRAVTASVLKCCINSNLLFLTVRLLAYQLHLLYSRHYWTVHLVVIPSASAQLWQSLSLTHTDLHSECTPVLSSRKSEMSLCKMSRSHFSVIFGLTLNWENLLSTLLQRNIF